MYCLGHSPLLLILDVKLVANGVPVCFLSELFYCYSPSCSSSVALPFAWINGSVAFPRGFPRRLSHEAFPRGFVTGLSHEPPWCVSILGLKFEAVQGKQVSLEWTETSGGLWKWWLDPGVPLAFPVESTSS